MKKTLLTLAMLCLAFSSNAFAQDSRTYSLPEFYQGLELGHFGRLQKLMFLKDGKPIDEHLSVSVPAGYQLKLMFEGVGTGKAALYMANIEDYTPFSVKDVQGVKPSTRTTRVSFNCMLGSRARCEQRFLELLKTGFQVESVGVVNFMFPTNDLVPDLNLIFGFVLTDESGFR